MLFDLVSHSGTTGEGKMLLSSRMAVMTGGQRLFVGGVLG
jgi:hypothetical protein